MGRKRKITLSQLNERTLECKCGRMVEVNDDNVVDVTCCFCLTKSVPLRLLSPEAMAEYEELEKKRINEATVKPTKLSKNGKKLGRPRKTNPTVSIDSGPMKKKLQSKALDEIFKRGRKTVEVKCEKPTKVKAAIRNVKKQKANPKPVKAKKGNTMDKVKGKRGRKPTVGAKVLGFITQQNGNVDFPEILRVYSEEREKLGKKDTPKVEERNCRSTLYILVRDGKLREVDAKKTYATM